MLHPQIKVVPTCPALAAFTLRRCWPGVRGERVLGYTGGRYSWRPDTRSLLAPATAPFGRAGGWQRRSCPTTIDRPAEVSPGLRRVVLRTFPRNGTTPLLQNRTLGSSAMMPYKSKCTD